MKIKSIAYLFLSGTVIFVTVNYTYNYLFKDEIARFDYVLIESIIMSIVITLFFSFSKLNFKITEILNKDVTIKNKISLKFECYSNYLIGLFGIGGKIFITDKKIYFIPHKFNLIKKGFEINIDRVKKFGVVNKILNIYKLTTSGKSYKIVLDDQEVIAYLSK